MPINKDALKRYQIIDRMLSDPNNDYTTEKILWSVNHECEHVTKRMIQKDIKNIEEYFGKSIIRNSGGRGTVKYKDQSEPLFFKELTCDEEDVLREVLKSLGQFEGLDNFTWLELLKKKLDYKNSKQQPYISFSKNVGLQIPKTLLGRLFSAISRKKVIKVRYTKFNEHTGIFTVYPYQLKQYNDRWFLLCTPLADDKFPYRKDFVMNLALDRMDEQFEYVEDEPYVETGIDLQARFDEIIGVTLDLSKEIEDIYFAVAPNFIPYIRTKWMHNTQIELDNETQIMFRKKYPTLKEYTFFSIECRENNELYNLFSGYSRNIILVEPLHLRKTIETMISEAANNYNVINTYSEE